MRHQDQMTDAQWQEMAQAAELQRQRLLLTPSLHTAAGVSSGDFFACCELIKASHQEHEHFETNLPLFFSHPDIATEINRYRHRYPHLFESVGSGGLIKPGTTRWKLSWIGRSFFKEYPYQVDISWVDGKLQTYLDCTWDALIEGVPMILSGHLACDVQKYHTFNATSFFCFGVEEDLTQDFDFNAHKIPTGPKFQLQTGAIIEDGKEYPIALKIKVGTAFYQPYGEIDLLDGYMGLDGTIRSR